MVKRAASCSVSCTRVRLAYGGTTTSAYLQGLLTELHIAGEKSLYIETQDNESCVKQNEKFHKTESREIE